MIDKKRIMKKKFSIVAFYLSIIAIFCIINPIGDDMMFHLLRIGELGNELRRGSAFPVYMYRDVYSYFGYPLPIFYCSFFLYPFAALVCMGASAIFAYKIMVIVIMLGVFFSAYFSLMRWRNNTEFAMAGAFVYGIQPYFLIDLFVRAAIGEAFAFIFIPIVLLGFWLAISGENNIEAVIGLALGMTGIVCSHVISTFLMIITLAVIFVIECIRRKVSIKVLFRLCMSALICLFLSLWYVAPLVEQMLTMTFRAEDTNNFAKGTVDFISLLIPMHMNLVVSSVFHIDLRPVQVGGAILVVIAFVIYAYLSGIWHKLPQKVKVLLVMCGVLTICLMIPVIWIPLGKVIGFIQFPWRIFIIISVIGTMSIVLTLDANRDNVFYKNVLTISMVSAVYVLITFFAYFMLRGVLYNVTGGSLGSADTRVVYTTETSDDLYLSSYVSDELFSENRSISLPENGTIDYGYVIDTDEGKVVLSISQNQSDSGQWVEFPFLMYKGYAARNVNDQTEYQVRMSQRGLVEVLIPAGTVGDVVVSYVGTVVQAVSFYVSVISIVALIVLLLILRKGGLCKIKKA